MIPNKIKKNKIVTSDEKSIIKNNLLLNMKTDSPKNVLNIAITIPQVTTSG